MCVCSVCIPRGEAPGRVHGPRAGACGGRVARPVVACRIVCVRAHTHGCVRARAGGGVCVCARTHTRQRSQEITHTPVCARASGWGGLVGGHTYAALPGTDRNRSHRPDTTTGYLKLPRARSDSAGVGRPAATARSPHFNRATDIPRSYRGHPAAVPAAVPADVPAAGILSGSAGRAGLGQTRPVGPVGPVGPQT